MITDDFLMEEERNGFLISSEMKHVWAAEMKVLSAVTDICEKHGITYFADYGTLLGCVRHGGFVPWDDDIDICLKRADYMHLLKYLREELPSNYNIDSYYTSLTHRQPFCSVMNYCQIPIPEDIKMKFYGCPYIAGIDIYPLDYIPRDKELAETMFLLYSAVYDLAQRFEEFRDNGELENYVLQIEEMCQVSLVRDDTLLNQLLKLQDNIASMFTDEESDCITFVPRVVMGDTDFRFNKEWYQKPVKRKFENMNINIPSGYDDVLKMLYGDYKKCVQNVSAHGYPYYAMQKEWLEKHGLS